MTDDDIEEIKRKKAEEMLQKHHRKELAPEVLDWSFRFNLKRVSRNCSKGRTISGDYTGC